VIAAVNGHAYAGGLETVLVCDFAYAVSTARFALTDQPDDGAFADPCRDIYVQRFLPPAFLQAEAPCTTAMGLFQCERDLRVDVATAHLKPRSGSRAALTAEQALEEITEPTR